MSDITLGADAGGTEVGELVDALTDSRRRAVLRALAENEAPLAADELAERVLAETTEPPDAVDDRRRRRVRSTLRHRHLPVLAEAGAVERDEEGVTLSADVPGELGRLLAGVETVPDDALELLADLLRSPTRRAVVAELDDRGPGTTIHLDRLAASVAAGADPERSTADVLTALHHHHLPRLAEEGVLEYDPGTRTVEYLGTVVFPDAWVSGEATLSDALSAGASFERRDPPA